MVAERRRSPRYRFIADAEVKEILADTNLEARTGDLSIGGCFLDTQNPLPKDTKIQVIIRHQGSTFTAIGRVAFVVPNMGIGVAFTQVDGDQVSVLQKWLSDSTCMSSEHTNGRTEQK